RVMSAPDRSLPASLDGSPLGDDLLSLLPLAVALVELRPAVRLRYVSPQFESMTGYSPSALLADPEEASRLVMPEDLERIRDGIRNLRRDGDRFSGELRLRCSDDTVRWLSCEAVARCRHVSTLAVLLTLADVTEQRAVQAQAEERADRERKLESQLIRADRLAAVGQLAAGIAHEVNNALASLLPYGSLLSIDASLPEYAREHGRKIEEQAHRIAAIVRGLLNLARPELPRKARWPLAELVGDTLTLVGTEAKRADISVVTRLPPDMTVIGDRGQLQQVVLNLVSNAIQAMVDQPVRRLEIDASGTESHVELRVIDTGPGVAPEIRDRLFTGFVTTRPHGSGLGLNVSASIIRAHGGDLYLDETATCGSCFVIRLPAMGEAEDVREAAPVTPLPETGTICALVVDDEPGVRIGFAKLLERHGVRVEAVGDGTSALRRLEDEVYDVVFLDLRMPGMSGIDVYERLRQQCPAQASRVVIMTADAASLEVRVFLESIDLPVLLKPFDLGTVRRAIAQAGSLRGGLGH
ncbi:MAG: hybrid sensor histidine kinase/response regulator, partial [Candidatus Binatia bacterium]